MKPNCQCVDDGGALRLGFGFWGCRVKGEIKQLGAYSAEADRWAVRQGGIVCSWGEGGGIRGSHCRRSTMVERDARLR